MPKIKLTLTTVDKIPLADKGRQIDYWDTELKGFGCRVSSASKTYFVMRRVNSKQTRVTLGKHGIIKPDSARKKAINNLAQLHDGVDINREKARERIRGNSLQDVYDDYLVARHQMKDSTKVVDNSLLNSHLSDWLDKPIKDITRDMVVKRHKGIAKASSGITANNAMRLLRRIYNYAQSAANGELAPNPVQVLSDARLWYPVGRRQTVLKEHEIPFWYAATQKIDNATIKDYLLLLLFTGLRKNEAIKIEWKGIDFKGKTFTVSDTKNKKPLTLPMSDYLEELFKRRLRMKENKYVFPGTGENGHLIEPKRQVNFIHRETHMAVNGITDEDKYQKLLADDPDSLEPGVVFCLHDLRRTFASVAESLVSYSALKRLMNHSDKDVTQGYIVFDANKLRGPMQMITNEICRLANIDINSDNKTKTSEQGPNQEQLTLLY